MSPTSYQLLYSAIFIFGAGDRTRTGTVLLPGDFKSPVSTIPPHRRISARSNLSQIEPCVKEKMKKFLKKWGETFSVPQKKRHFAGENAYTVQVRKGGIPMWPQKNNETDVDDMIFQEEWHISER